MGFRAIKQSVHGSKEYPEVADKKDIERDLVVLSDALLEPPTMMVVPFDVGITIRAVFG